MDTKIVVGKKEEKRTVQVVFTHSGSHREERHIKRSTRLIILAINIKQNSNRANDSKITSQATSGLALRDRTLKRTSNWLKPHARIREERDGDAVGGERV